MKKQELIIACKSQRKTLGLTQQSVADRIGWYKTRISEWESGKSNFTTDSLLLLISAYELKIS